MVVYAWHAKTNVNSKRKDKFKTVLCFHEKKTKTDDQRQDVNDYPVKEQYVLSRLLPEYVSLYRIDLNSGKYEILRLDANTNARQLAEKDPHPAENFDEYVRRYADNFILDEEKEEFIDWHLAQICKRRLLHEEKFTYHTTVFQRKGKIAIMKPM